MKKFDPKKTQLFSILSTRAGRSAGDSNLLFYAPNSPDVYTTSVTTIDTGVMTNAGWCTCARNETYET